MRFNLLEVLSLVTAVAAHGHAHTSPVENVEAVAFLRNRNIFSTPEAPLEKRQANDGVVPPGPGLGYISRNKVGSVPYGTEIRSCYQKGVIALTFDDGPTQYTTALLDLLARYNAKATFFINGNNGRQIYKCDTEYPAIVKRMYREGHQVASHTWSHADLSTLDSATFNREIYWNEQAINNILGIFPTYIRPPYLSCDATCQSRLGVLGYHTIQTDLDTLDWDNDAENEIINSKNIFDNALNGKVASQTSYLPLMHDNHYWTVYGLAEHALKKMASSGYAAVTVGTCLNDPKGNWYRQGTGTTPCPSTPVVPPVVVPQPTGTLPMSPNGECGSGKYTCAGLATEYRCCSQYGWCGATSDHCGTGCQSAFGVCV